MQDECSKLSRTCSAVSCTTRKNVHSRRVNEEKGVSRISSQKYQTASLCLGRQYL